MRSGKSFLKTPALRSSRRFGTSSGKSTGGRLVGLTVATVGTATAGVATYAAYDPEFRKQVENVIPYSKVALNYTIGEPEPPAPRLKELRPLQFSNDPKVAPKPFEPKAVTGSKPSPTPALETIAVNDAPTRKELIGVKTPVSVLSKKNTVVVKKAVNPYLGSENALDKNEALTEELKKRVQEAEKATKAATTAKLESIRAIEHHIQMIREAIEGGKDGDWDLVTLAHAKAQRQTNRDIESEKLARNAVADLVVEANLGSQGETTQLNPLVPISKATAEKLSNELDEMVSSIKKIDSERIFTRDYGRLVDESRKKFLLELKAVHPDLNYEEGQKMKKSDLRTILAHAHLRVDQLSMQLIDHRMREEKRVKEAIDAKKKEYLGRMKEMAVVNSTPVKAELSKDDKKRFDEELASRVKEVKEKYDRRLEEVVRTQKQLYDIEHAQDVEKAVSKERDFHSVQIGKALAQLEGIEKALKGHLQMDIENRRSKQMWLAVQNLVDTVEYGKRGSCCMEGRRIPLDAQMKTLIKCSGDDKVMKLIDESMSRVTKVKGEYTKEDLNTRFSKVCRIGRRVAYVDESTGGGIIDHLTSWLRSKIVITLPVSITKDNKVVRSAESNYTLLTRAEALWKAGKRLDAIRVLQLTTGATRRLARDFIEDARRHEEALLLTRLLLAHTALTSIRSTY